MMNTDKTPQDERTPTPHEPPPNIDPPDPTFDAEIVSGTGKYQSPNNRLNPQPFDTTTAGKIVELVFNPPQTPKDQARWAIPSTLLSRVAAEQQSNGRFVFAWCDVDTHTELDALVAVLKSLNCYFVVYSSRSATPGCKKWRVIVFFENPVNYEVWAAVQQTLNNMLETAGITPDRASERANQILYTPNRGEYYEFHINHEAPLLDCEAHFHAEIAAFQHTRMVKKQELAERLEASKRKAQALVVAGTHNPIQAFNAAHSIDDLLAKYGYVNGVSPNSRSGTPSVVVFIDKKGRETWRSYGEGDRAAGIGQIPPDGSHVYGDPFDLFKFYEHANDQTAALKAVGDMFIVDGTTMTKANQRNYMEAKQTEAARLHIDAVLAASNAPPPEEYQELDQLPATGTHANVVPISSKKPATTPQKPKPDESPSLDLIRMFEHAVFMSDQKVPYITVTINGIEQTLVLNSQQTIGYLNLLWYRIKKTPISPQYVNQVLATLAGIAASMPVSPVYLRCAVDPSAYYLDMGDQEFRVIEVTPSGWRITNRPPVKFRRSTHMLPLPEPATTPEFAGIGLLWKHVNVHDHDDQLRLLAWMLEAYRPGTPYPILAITGIEGSAKSQSHSRIRDLVDPSVANLSTAPNNLESVAVTANWNWVVSYENLSSSSLPKGAQDLLCSISTGGGYRTRTLHTTNEETVYQIARPIILNGINNILIQPDVVSRILLLELPPLAERLTETELDEMWAMDAPIIFGSLMNLFSATLQELPNVKLKNPPRMADFCYLGEAMARALGHPDGHFTGLMVAARLDTARDMLDAAPVGRAVLRFVQDAISKHTTNAKEAPWPQTAPVYSGLMGEFQKLLETRENSQAIENMMPYKPLTNSPRHLAGILRRLQPGLKLVGIDVIIPTKGEKGGLPRRNGTPVQIFITDDYKLPPADGGHDK